MPRNGGGKTSNRVPERGRYGRDNSRIRRRQARCRVSRIFFAASQADQHPFPRAHWDRPRSRKHSAPTRAKGLSPAHRRVYRGVPPETQRSRLLRRDRQPRSPSQDTLSRRPVLSRSATEIDEPTSDTLTLRGDADRDSSFRVAPTGRPQPNGDEPEPTSQTPLGRQRTRASGAYSVLAASRCSAARISTASTICTPLHSPRSAKMRSLSSIVRTVFKARTGMMQRP
jgi:hypothetical protein